MRTFTAQHTVRQIRINNVRELGTWNLEEFAREGGTEIRHDFPIFLILIDGQPAAWYYAAPHVGIYPNVHPSAMSSPRAFYEAARLVVASTKRSFCDPLWLIDSKSKLANEATLNKIGLYEEPLKVWYPR